MGGVPEHHILVGEVALPVDKMVVLRPTDIFRVAVEKMSRGRLGIACVVEGDGTLVGVFTDGDIRRLLLSEHKPIAALFSEDIGDHMIRNPKTIRATTSLKSGVSLMDAADVLDLPVVEESGRLVGLLHLHSALKHLLGL